MNKTQSILWEKFSFAWYNNKEDKIDPLQFLVDNWEGFHPILHKTDRYIPKLPTSLSPQLQKLISNTLGTTNYIIADHPWRIQDIQALTSIKEDQNKAILYIQSENLMLKLICEYIIKGDIIV